MNTIARPLLLLCISFFGASIVACGAATEDDVMSGDDALHAQPGDACPADRCGPMPMLAAQPCADGTTPSPVCERTARNVCGWRFTSCPVPPPPPGPPVPPPVPVCDKSSCGPMPMMATQLCWDGSSTGPTCEYVASTSSCGWQFTQCPPEPVCDAKACGPNPYGMPNTQCKDGSIAGPVCKPASSGTCGWTIASCPP